MEHDRRDAARIATLTLLAAGLVSSPAPAADVWTLVVSAPGYPSDTAEAQPTMDAFAAGLAAAAGWPAERLRAVYHSTVDGGTAALAADGAALALTPLPFYLERREALALEPLLAVEAEDGGDEWSLVARRGALSGPSSLAGWEIAGNPGYSPRFVRRVALSRWGALPEQSSIRFSSRVLSELRRASRGEPVAALLDRSQTEALDSLPWAAELEIVARSGRLPGSLLCRVGPGVPDEAAERLSAALRRLHRDEAGRGLLDTVRIRRFVELDTARLARVERAFAGDGAPAR